MPWAFSLEPLTSLNAYDRPPQIWWRERDTNGRPEEEDCRAASGAVACRLPSEDPDRAGLRCCHRDRARSCREPVAPPGKQGAAEARRHPAGVQLQAARRIQQDGAVEPGPPEAWRHLRLGRQPRAGRGAGRETPGVQGVDRDAGHDAAGQGRCGALAWRRGGADGRELLRRPPARPRTRNSPQPDVRSPV